MSTAKTLFRKRQGSMIAGVAAGLADYLEADVTWIRLGFLLLSFGGGIGIMLYLAGMIIVPHEPSKYDSEPLTARPIEDRVEEVTKQMSDNLHRGYRSGNTKGGIFLIALGLIFLLHNYIEWFSWSRLWPLILIGFGLSIVLRRNGNAGDK